jgi:prepilin-type N-terminal cleavage/methylation domain-containing protein
MLDRIKKDNKGFTIIEVLIVLAIAGLIMIIVFLAVPALQRNQRNQSYRTEANNISAAYQELSSNSNGAALADTTDASNVEAAANAKNFTTIIIEAETAASTPSLTQAVIRKAAKCNTGLDGTDAGAARQIAVLFQVESTSGAVTQCINS